MIGIVDLSIIIPTYNERDNIAIIAGRIGAVLADSSETYEIIFIDDSNDTTPLALAALAKQNSHVRYAHRSGERGLASAVVEGFKLALGERMIVMDADLQHPPELIPLISRRLHEADVVIPSRFIEGGSDGGLDVLRKLISWTARTIARFSLRRLRDISDSTSGYFGVNRAVVEGADLDPVGWKILMEVLVKGNYETVHEIPYSFAVRCAGVSKMSCKEQWNYLRHIGKLVSASPEDGRFFTFCAVGALGVLVNLAALKLLLTITGMSEFSGSMIASFLAMINNFFWNDNFTWRGRQQPVLWRRVIQFPQFVMVCGIGIGVTAVFAQAFVLQNWNVYLGQMAGIMVSTAWSFLANNAWTWAEPKGECAQRRKLVVTQEYAGNSLK